MSTFTLDSDLSAVNSILAAIGQAPTTAAALDDAYTNPELALIYNLLKETTVDVNSEEWHYNTEKHKDYQPTDVGTEKHFTIPASVLRMDVSEGQTTRTTDVVMKQGKLYNNEKHTYDVKEWDVSSTDNYKMYFDLVYNYAFNEVPAIFQRYITLRASQRAATQLVSNAELTKLLAEQVGLARAACIEFDTNQSDANMFGFSDQNYTAYQPFRTLIR
jgi:hypothetical protein